MQNAKCTINNRGIAIILVLGTITILSALVADFAFNSQVQLRLAMNGRNRLQAEYLARSGINFLRLLMVKEQTIKTLVRQFAGDAFDPKIPLCQQFPMSTEALRGLFDMMNAGAGVDKGAASEKAAASEKGKIVTAFDKSEAQEFLKFHGDFEGKCEDESSKFDLNIFAALDSMEQTIGGLNTYDRYKQTLEYFLKQPEVKELFGEEAEHRIPEVVRNIADWVDKDDRTNERPNQQGGSEVEIYHDVDSTFHPRNAPMLTLDEAYLIAGVTDEWFTPLRPYFTIYGGGKINICTAQPAVVQSLILSYAASNPRIPPVNPDNKEMMKMLRDVVAMDCAGTSPSVATITQHVESILMGEPIALNAAAGGAPTMTNTPGTGTTAAGGAGGTFANLIELSNGPMRLIGIGRVPSGTDRETEVRIETVIDSSAADPKQWKLLYWKME